MTTDTLTRALDAIISQDTSAHITPSGPLLTLLTELAEHGDLMGFSEAFTLFRIANPENAAFVVNTVPAKILNGYLLKHLGLCSVAFIEWEKSNTKWANEIMESLPVARIFEATVHNIADEIKSIKDA